MLRSSSAPVLECGLKTSARHRCSGLPIRPRTGHPAANSCSVRHSLTYRNCTQEWPAGWIHSIRALADTQITGWNYTEDRGGSHTRASPGFNIHFMNNSSSVRRVGDFNCSSVVGDTHGLRIDLCVGKHLEQVVCIQRTHHSFCFCSAF